MILLLLIDIKLIDLLKSFLFFVKFPDLPIEVVELELKGVPFSWMTSFLVTNVNEFFGTCLEEALKSWVLSLLLLKDTPLLGKMLLVSHICVNEESMDLI